MAFLKYIMKVNVHILNILMSENTLKHKAALGPQITTTKTNDND